MNKDEMIPVGIYYCPYFAYNWAKLRFKKEARENNTAWTVWITREEIDMFGSKEDAAFTVFVSAIDDDDLREGFSNAYADGSLVCVPLDQDEIKKYVENE